jgi:Spy/CpxP family protein refolding chaperone
MMKLLRMCLTAALVLAIASALATAQDKKGKLEKGPATSSFDRFARWERLNTLRQAVAKMNLTDEQKSKLREIHQEILPKIAEVSNSMDGVLTDAQKQAAIDAGNKAFAAGKRGRELLKASVEGVKFTDEQRKQLEEPVKNLGELERDLIQKIMGILNDEQKAELKKALGNDGKKPAKAAAKE